MPPLQKEIYFKLLPHWIGVLQRLPQGHYPTDERILIPMHSDFLLWHSYEFLTEMSSRFFFFFDTLPYIEFDT